MNWPYNLILSIEMIDSVFVLTIYETKAEPAI